MEIVRRVPTYFTLYLESCILRLVSFILYLESNDERLYSSTASNTSMSLSISSIVL